VPKKPTHSHEKSRPQAVRMAETIAVALPALAKLVPPHPMGVPSSRSTFQPAGLDGDLVGKEGFLANSFIHCSASISVPVSEPNRNSVLLGRTAAKSTGSSANEGFSRRTLAFTEAINAGSLARSALGTFMTTAARLGFPHSTLAVSNSAFGAERVSSLFMWSFLFPERPRVALTTPGHSSIISTVTPARRVSIAASHQTKLRQKPPSSHYLASLDNPECSGS
jgi:hypothetical protein